MAIAEFCHEETFQDGDVVLVEGESAQKFYVIARGKRRDWTELRRAALADRAVLEKALRVCQAHIADPSAQRYHFWKQYAERHLA